MLWISKSNLHELEDNIILTMKVYIVFWVSFFGMHGLNKTIY